MPPQDEYVVKSPPHFQSILDMQVACAAMLKAGVPQHWDSEPGTGKTSMVLMLLDAYVGRDWRFLDFNFVDFNDITGPLFRSGMSYDIPPERLQAALQENDEAVAAIKAKAAERGQSEDAVRAEVGKLYGKMQRLVTEGLDPRVIFSKGDPAFSKEPLRDDNGRPLTNPETGEILYRDLHRPIFYGDDVRQALAAVFNMLNSVVLNGQTSMDGKTLHNVAWCSTGNLAGGGGASGAGSKEFHPALNDRLVQSTFAWSDACKKMFAQTRFAATQNHIKFVNDTLNYVRELLGDVTPEMLASADPAVREDVRRRQQEAMAFLARQERNGYFNALFRLETRLSSMRSHRETGREISDAERNVAPDSALHLKFIRAMVTNCDAAAIRGTHETWSRSIAPQAEIEKFEREAEFVSYRYSEAARNAYRIPVSSRKWENSRLLNMTHQDWVWGYQFTVWANMLSICKELPAGRAAELHKPAAWNRYWSEVAPTIGTELFKERLRSFMIDHGVDAPTMASVEYFAFAYAKAHDREQIFGRIEANVSEFQNIYGKANREKLDDVRKNPLRYRDILDNYENCRQRWMAFRDRAVRAAEEMATADASRVKDARAAVRRAEDMAEQYLAASLVVARNNIVDNMNPADPSRVRDFFKEVSSSPQRIRNLLRFVDELSTGFYALPRSGGQAVDSSTALGMQEDLRNRVAEMFSNYVAGKDGLCRTSELHSLFSQKVTSARGSVAFATYLEAVCEHVDRMDKGAGGAGAGRRWTDDLRRAAVDLREHARSMGDLSRPLSDVTPAIKKAIRYVVKSVHDQNLFVVLPNGEMKTLKALHDQSGAEFGSLGWEDDMLQGRDGKFVTPNEDGTYGAIGADGRTVAVSRDVFLASGGRPADENTPIVVGRSTGELMAIEDTFNRFFNFLGEEGRTILNVAAAMPGITQSALAKSLEQLDTAIAVARQDAPGGGAQGGAARAAAVGSGTQGDVLSQYK